MKNFTIETDGVTVWINNAVGCIGRFAKYGIDVHSDPTEQHELGECLYCTHTRTTKADWIMFLFQMYKHHGIKIPIKYEPKNLK